MADDSHSTRVIVIAIETDETVDLAHLAGEAALWIARSGLRDCGVDPAHKGPTLYEGPAALAADVEAGVVTEQEIDLLDVSAEEFDPPTEEIPRISQSRWLTP